MTDATLVHERRATATITTAVTGRHLPALNGLRGVAVMGVVAYHLQLGWASGWVPRGRPLLRPVRFPHHHALARGVGRAGPSRPRRLLGAPGPAAAAGTVPRRGGARRCTSSSTPTSVVRAPTASSTWPGSAEMPSPPCCTSNNWHLIFAHQSYFAQFSTPSPLQHTWSLAIEEQFYLVWPLVLLVLLRYGRRGWRRVGVAVTVVARRRAPRSLMAVLFHPGVDPSRIYYGTDTRLFDLMAGATIAFLAAARPQPSAPARRTLHWVGPVAAVALAVFWVRARHRRGPADQLHVRGRVPALCRARRAGRGRRPPRCSPGGSPAGWPGGRCTSSAPSPTASTCGTGRSSSTSTGPGPACRPGPSTSCASSSRWCVSTASYYLVERPIRLARFRGGVRVWGPAGRRRHGSGDRRGHDPRPWPIPPPWSARRISPPPARGGRCPARVATRARADPSGAAPTAADPLRVMILGDSVMHDASYGITASLQATGEATVATRTIDGFGLTTATNWPTSIPNLIRQTRAQLIVATWSWDQYGPTTPNALHQPAQYTKLLRRAVATMLTPGNGVEGVIFTQFPQSGDIAAANPADTAQLQPGAPGRRHGLERHRREDDDGLPGPGHVLPVGRLRPVARASTRPGSRPKAIRTRRATSGSGCASSTTCTCAPRAAPATPPPCWRDMTAVFHLAPAAADWSQGTWTTDPDFNDPPGACPDDHPPG